jgi:ubiquinone biosynthesis protein COQ4
VAALSCTVGSLRLSTEDRAVLLESYLPWAIEMSSRNDTDDGCLFLMNVYYEKEFDTPLDELRQRLHLQPAPTVSIGR